MTFNDQIIALLITIFIVIAIYISRKQQGRDRYAKLKREDAEEKRQKADKKIPRIWGKTLHITRPNSMSLKVELPLQRTEKINFFLDDKPVNGYVFSLFDEEDTWTLPSDYEKHISVEYYVKDGVANGNCNNYYRSGKLRNRRILNEDLENDGYEYEYDEDGNILYTMFGFKNGVKDGVETIYATNDLIPVTNYYVKGELVSKESYDLLQNIYKQVPDKNTMEEIGEIMSKLKKN